MIGKPHVLYKLDTSGDDDIKLCMYYS